MQELALKPFESGQEPEPEGTEARPGTNARAHGYAKAPANANAHGYANARAHANAHALVVVFLRGGADTLNMLVPYGDDDYYRFRPSLAIQPQAKAGKNGFLPLDSFFGLHPRLAPLLPIYKEGRLGFLPAVGSDNLSGSHFDAQDQMEHGVAWRSTASGGWLGRYLSLSGGHSLGPLAAVSLSPSLPESFRGAPAASALSGVEEISIKAEGAPHLTGVLQKLYKACPEPELREAGLNTLALLARISELRKAELAGPGDAALFPATSFGRGLFQIARLVKAGVGLNVACLDLDGWDTHFVQGSAEGLQAGIIAELGQGLAAFDKCLGPLMKDVTVVVMTEFGRRVYENSSLGTDHGRGFTLMAMGGGIRGGQVHGQWPGLQEDLDELRLANLAPTGLAVKVDYREPLLEILQGVMGAGAYGERIFPGFRPGFRSGFQQKSGTGLVQM